MRVYRLVYCQHIPRDVEEVFAFFAEAHNLERLTPAFLRFRIVTPAPICMQAGTLIDYRLHLFGVPVHWRTRIATFEPPWRFTDVQLHGPYRVWHHTHEFRQVPGGTCMVDRVEYVLPLGMLGTLAHVLFVRRTLRRIFAYRAQQLPMIFPPLA